MTSREDVRAFWRAGATSTRFHTSGERLSGRALDGVPADRSAQIVSSVSCAIISIVLSRSSPMLGSAIGILAGRR